MSPGLKRARDPFRVKNALTGLGIAAFCVGVWAYSISAVKQDVFDDLDEEAKALAGARDNENTDKTFTNGTSATTTTTPATGIPATKATNTASVKSSPSVAIMAASGAPKGVVAALLDRTYPRALDPTRKTLVWGAPSVDKIGRLGDRT
jgi:cytochrome c oxidase assembly factor 3, fungi type